MKFELEKDFAENTTLHGISRIFTSGGVLLKLIWSAVFLVASGLFVWQFADRLSTYFKYEYNTVIEVNYFLYIFICLHRSYRPTTICNAYSRWKFSVEKE